MLRFIFFVTLLLGSSGYHSEANPIPRKLSIYEIAEMKTGTSAKILRAIAIVESGENDSAIGDDGVSIGRFQWNTKFLPWFWQKYGYFDPRDGQMAAIRAGQLFADNLKILGSHDLAIAAHKQGPTGVKKYGPCLWYVRKVKGAER